MALNDFDPRYAEFRKLFNAKKFFEAHEVLELLWRETKGPERDFYQGLIQIAAVFVHIQKQTPEGGRKLLEKASAKLGKFEPRFMGLEISKLLSQTARALESEADFPKIRIR